jgi:hypothetical protein
MHACMCTRGSFDVADTAKGVEALEGDDVPGGSGRLPPPGSPLLGTSNGALPTAASLQNLPDPSLPADGRIQPPQAPPRRPIDATDAGLVPKATPSAPVEEPAARKRRLGDDKASDRGLKKKVKGRRQTGKGALNGKNVKFFLGAHAGRVLHLHAMNSNGTLPHRVRLYTCSHSVIYISECLCSIQILLLEAS